MSQPTRPDGIEEIGRTRARLKRTGPLLVVVVRASRSCHQIWCLGGSDHRSFSESTAALQYVPVPMMHANYILFVVRCVFCCCWFSFVVVAALQGDGVPADILGAPDPCRAFGHQGLWAEVVRC